VVRKQGARKKKIPLRGKWNPVSGKRGEKSRGEKTRSGDDVKDPEGFLIRKGKENHFEKSFCGKGGARKKKKKKNIKKGTRRKTSHKRKLNGGKAPIPMAKKKKKNKKKRGLRQEKKS